MTETKDDTYNGWCNYETWAAALHLSNDQGLYNACTEIVAEADAEWPDSPWVAAERLKEWVDENVIYPVLHPEPGDEAADWQRSMIADVGSFHRVDWADVADSFREE